VNLGFAVKVLGGGGLPSHDTDELAAALEAVAAVAPRARTIIYGHLGDRNLHVNVLGPDPHDEAVDEAVLELVGEFGGSISSEHGVGVAKRRWLHLTRSPEEIAVMAAVKDALDPQGILNPGVLLPDPGVERALVSIGGGITCQGP
jgi:FAD/FMN-containing dehydrogenase